MAIERERKEANGRGKAFINGGGKCEVGARGRPTLPLLGDSCVESGTVFKRWQH